MPDSEIVQFSDSPPRFYVRRADGTLLDTPAGLVRFFDSEEEARTAAEEDADGKA